MNNLTKKAIVESFLRLLEKKNLGSITVKDIVSDIGINRKTFYYYYSDIYDLAEKVFRSSMNEFRASFSEDSAASREAVVRFAHYLNDNRKIVMHVYQTLGYEKMTSLFFEMIMDYYPTRISDHLSGYDILPEDGRRIAEYNAFIFSSLLTRWIKEGMVSLPQDELERFSRLMDGTIEIELENAHKLKRDMG